MNAQTRTHAICYNVSKYYIFIMRIINHYIAPLSILPSQTVANLHCLFALSLVQVQNTKFGSRPHAHPRSLTHTHTHAHTHTHTRTYAHTHARTHTHTQARTHACIHSYMLANKHSFITGNKLWQFVKNKTSINS